MFINIKTTVGNIEMDICENDTIKDVIGMIIKHFKLYKYGNYVLGKQNHVFLEFAKGATLKECGMVDGDTLQFIIYNGEV